MASPFITGLFGGAARGLDVGLQKHFDRVGKNFDDRMMKILESATARKLKHEDKSDKAEEALQLIAGLTPDGNLRNAAEVIRKIGGVTQAPEFFKRFTSALATNKDLTLAKVVPFMEAKHGDMTMEQAMNQVRKPFNFEVPAALGEATQKDNLFSRLFGPNYAKQRETIGKELTARGLSNSEAVQLAKMRDGKVNWGMIASPEERLAERHARGTVETLEQNLTRGARQIQLLDLEIKEKPKEFQRLLEAHNSSMTSAKFNIKDKTSRLAIFERNNTAEDTILARRKLVADIIASESGSDAEEHWNILDSRERFYKDAVRKATPGTVNPNQVNEWNMQIQEIQKSKAALTQTMAADASTVYSKDSPKGIFNDALKTSIQTIAGVKFSENINEMITGLDEGKLGEVLGRYKAHANDMYQTFGRSSHQGIQMQLQIADNQARTAEVMIFTKLWEMAKEDGLKPKKLYKEDDKGNLIYEPKPPGWKEGQPRSPQYAEGVEANDPVIINWPSYADMRRDSGYINPTKAIWTKYGLIGELAGSSAERR